MHVLVVGHQCGAVAQAAQALQGVAQVLVADNSAYEAHLAENVAKLLVDLAPNYSHILAAASSAGKDTLPRVAALLDVAQISEVIGVVSSDTFVRPIYAGNALATVQSHDAIKVMTVRASAFDAAAQGNSAAVTTLDKVFEAKTQFVSQSLTVSARPELGNAGIIVSGGRGMGSGENFGMLEQLADKLGAAVGASRAAVDAGFVPNDLRGSNR